jgi:ABC-type transporter Mla subunit MlaD
MQQREELARAWAIVDRLTAEQAATTEAEALAAEAQHIEALVDDVARLVKQRDALDHFAATLRDAAEAVLREHDYWTYPWSDGKGRNHKFDNVQESEARAYDALAAALAATGGEE